MNGPIYYGIDFPRREVVSVSVITTSAIGLLAGPLSLALAVPYVTAVILILCAAVVLCGYAAILFVLIG